MKYLPTPKTILVKYLPPEQKIGILIVPCRDNKKIIGEVIAIGESFPFTLHIGQKLMFYSYSTQLDEKEGIFALEEDNILCLINEE